MRFWGASTLLFEGSERKCQKGLRSSLRRIGDTSIAFKVKSICSRIYRWIWDAKKDSYRKICRIFDTTFMQIRMCPTSIVHCPTNIVHFARKGPVCLFGECADASLWTRDLFQSSLVFFNVQVRSVSFAFRPFQSSSAICFNRLSSLSLFKCDRSGLSFALVMFECIFVISFPTSFDFWRRCELILLSCILICCCDVSLSSLHLFTLLQRCKSIIFWSFFHSLLRRQSNLLSSFRKYLLMKCCDPNPSLLISEKCSCNLNSSLNHLFQSSDAIAWTISPCLRSFWCSLKLSPQFWGSCIDIPRATVLLAMLLIKVLRFLQES